MAEEEKSKKLRKEEDEPALDQTMDLKYQPGKPKLPSAISPEISEKAKKEMERTRERMEKLKKLIIKKYPFTLSLGIIPPQAADKFDEENELTEAEKKEKPMHILMIIPEDNFKDIGKIKAEMIKEISGMKLKIWLNIITPVDIWNYCLDS